MNHALNRFFLLSVLVALCVTYNLISCSEDDELLTEEIFDEEVLENPCSDNERCKGICRTQFLNEDSLVRKCQNLKVKQVNLIRTALRIMQKGSRWNGIRAEHVREMMQFEETLLLRYAGISSEQSQKMLVWLGEHPEIMELVEDDKVLQKAFETIAGPRYRSKQSLFEGMKTPIRPITRGRTPNETFFEVCALSDNLTGFLKAHNLLVEECQAEGDRCVQDVYCDINKSIIHSRLEEWIDGLKFRC